MISHGARAMENLQDHWLGEFRDDALEVLVNQLKLVEANFLLQE